MTTIRDYPEYAEKYRDAGFEPPEPPEPKEILTKDDVLEHVSKQQIIDTMLYKAEVYLRNLNVEDVIDISTEGFYKEEGNYIDNPLFIDKDYDSIVIECQGF